MASIKFSKKDNTLLSVTIDKQQYKNVVAFSHGNEGINFFDEKCQLVVTAKGNEEKQLMRKIYA